MRKQWDSPVIGRHTFLSFFFFFLRGKHISTDQITITIRKSYYILIKKSCDKPRQHILKQRHQFADKDPYRQSYGFSSNHVWMWELDHKKDWVPKNFCFWIVVLEETLKSPLDGKEIKPVNPKGNQSWIFIRMTDAEAEAPILW